jgi:uncharacterized protein (TIGR03790 family)
MITRQLSHLVFVLVLVLLTASSAFALLPSEVAVVANRFVEESVDLARYYMQQRGIPSENLIKIDTVAKESCSRKRYDKDIAQPVRRALAKMKNIRALVTIYGVPLKVAAPELSRGEKKHIKKLHEQKKLLREQLKADEHQLAAEQKIIKAKISALDGEIKEIKKANYSAAVDSELSLVLAPEYDLKFWQSNPYFIGFAGQAVPIAKGSVLFVSRLDGSSVALVKRVIDDSLFAEKNGLSGSAYFDARWKKAKADKKLTGYALYDNSIHLAAQNVRKQALLPVVLDEQQSLFQPGSALDAALYCGWYSLGHYVDAFDWRRGAVGYHIASSECATLRGGSSQVWVKKMLEDGVAAAIGPVAEPYVQSFPIPELFFYYLTDGYYTLAEAYYLSLPYLSWRMVLIGDPLYRPFKQRSK